MNDRQKMHPWPGVVEHTCNPSTQEAEAEGLPVPGQPEPHSKTLSQSKNNQKKKPASFTKNVNKKNTYQV
jgi:hypothetical protein